MSSASTLTSIGVGICAIHGPMTGAVISSSDDVVIGENVYGSARIGDIVLGLCGDVGLITGGSDTIIVNDQGKASVGSVFVGIFSGTLTSGDDTVDIT